MEVAGGVTDEFLTCNICRKGYARPKQLPCLHTFCRDCLANYIADTVGATGAQRVPCPVCRRVTAPRDPNPTDLRGWADQFPDNFFIASLRETLEASRSGRGGGTQVTTGSRNSGGRGQDADQSQEGNVTYFMTQSGICSRHLDKQLVYYCTSHKEGVCELCLSDAGGPHSSCEPVYHLDAETARADATELFEDFSDKLQNLKDTVDKAKVTFTRKPHQLQRKKEEVELSINEHFVELRSQCTRLLLAKEKEMLEALKTVTEERGFQTAQDASKQCEDFSSSVVNTRSLLEMVPVKSGPFNALHILSSMEEQVSKFRSAVDRLSKEAGADELTFKPPERSVQDLLKGADLGRIIANFGHGEVVVANSAQGQIEVTNQEGSEGEARRREEDGRSRGSAQDAVENRMSRVSIDSAPRSPSQGRRGEGGEVSRGGGERRSAGSEQAGVEIRVGETSARSAPRSPLQGRRGEDGGSRRQQTGPSAPPLPPPPIDISAPPPYSAVAPTYPATSPPYPVTSPPYPSTSPVPNYGFRPISGSRSPIPGAGSRSPIPGAGSRSPIPGTGSRSPIPGASGGGSRSPIPGYGAAYSRPRPPPRAIRPMMVFSGNLPNEPRRGGLCGVAKLDQWNRAAFVDRHNHSLKIVDIVEAQIVGYLHLGNLEPWDVTFVACTKELVVTCPSAITNPVTPGYGGNYLVFVPTASPKLAIDYHVTTNAGYSCIAHIKGREFAGGVCAPFGSPLVHIFTAKGEVLREILPGTFAYPRSIFSDPAGSIVVVSDWTANVVVIATPEGELVGRYKDAYAPKGVAVSEESNLLYLLDGKFGKLHLLDHDANCVGTCKVEGCREPRMILVVPCRSDKFSDTEVPVVADGNNALHVYSNSTHAEYVSSMV